MSQLLTQGFQFRLEDIRYQLDLVEQEFTREVKYALSSSWTSVHRKSVTLEFLGSYGLGTRDVFLPLAN